MITIPVQNFNLEQISNSGECFRWFKIAENTYDIVAHSMVLRASQPNKDTLILDCDKWEYITTWKNYLALGIDYPRIGEYINKNGDSFLIDAYNYGSGIRILRQPIWETMVSFIISQRKSIPAIKTSIERLCRAYGEKIKGAEYYSFPGPERLVDLSEDDCGLGYRKEYIEELANQVSRGDFSIADLYYADYDDAKKMLLSVKGIGEKVANCILLFGLGHVGAFPVDVWIKRALDEHYPNGFPFERYEGFGGIVQQYMFNYVRNFKG